MRRVVRALLAAALAFGITAAPGGARAAGTWAPLDDGSDVPLIGGRLAYVHGEMVWTDYPFDDRGAGGTQIYPDGAPEWQNGADVIRIRLRPDGDDLVITARLSTLQDPRADAVLLVADINQNTTTAGAVWPFGAGITQPGGDIAILFTGQDGYVATWDGDAWVAVALADLGATIRTDLDENVIQVRLPSHAVGGLNGNWKLWGGAGRWDSGVTAFRPANPGGAGASNLYDLLFVTEQPGIAPDSFASVRQGQLLAEGNAGEGISVDWGRVRNGPDELPVHDPGETVVRMYRSGLDLGEGVVLYNQILGGEGSLKPGDYLYRSRYQPYLMFLPAQRPPEDEGSWLLFLHGADHDHETDWLGGVPGLTVPYAAVLGRGQSTFYVGAAEQDVLDVRSDVLGNYPQLLSTRLVLAGSSMGGIGAYRLALRYPDLWAEVVDIIGTADTPYAYTADGEDLDSTGATRPVTGRRPLPNSFFLAGSGENLVNLHNVPLTTITSGADELVNQATVRSDQARLQRLGYRYVNYTFPRRDHLAGNRSFWLDQMEAAVRRARLDVDPAEVIYRTYPWQEMSDGASGLNLRYRSAYWVADMQLRSTAREGDFGEVRAQALACGTRTHEAERYAQPGTYTDRRGADPLPGPRQDVYEESGIRWVNLQDVPRRNAAAATLANLSRVRFDLRRMCLNTSSFSLELAGDGSTDLVLNGGWDKGAMLHADGPAGPFDLTAAEDGTVTAPLSLAAQSQTYEFVVER